MALALVSPKRKLEHYPAFTSCLKESVSPVCLMMQTIPELGDSAPGVPCANLTSGGR